MRLFSSLIVSRRGSPCPRERFFVGTRKTDDGDAGGIVEEV